MPPKLNAPAAQAVTGGSLLMGTIFSAIAAFIGALVWFGIAKATEYEIGWIAWGVGIAAGFGMALGYKGRNAASGGIAAAMAIGGIVLGKYIVFITVVVPLIDQTFTQMFDGLSDDDVLQVHMTQEQLRQDGIDPMSATDEQTETASDQADRTIARMDASTKQTRTAEAKIAVRSLGSQAVMDDKAGFFFSSMFSPIDLLFIVIAVASAFKVATAGGESS